MMEESKRERFERLFEKRKEAAIHAIQNVFRLSKYPQTYEFTDSDFSEFKTEIMKLTESMEMTKRFHLNDQETNPSEFQLGQRVHCHSYLKKAKVPYVWYDPTIYHLPEALKEKPEDAIEFEEEISFPLFTEIKKEYDGVIIGRKKVPKERVADSEDHPYLGAVPYIYKNGTIDCYVVAFRLNQTRLVPVEQCEAL